MIDQDEANRSAGEGAKVIEREQEKRASEKGGKLGPLGGGTAPFIWKGCGGRSAVVRSVCTEMLGLGLRLGNCVNKRIGSVHDLHPSLNPPGQVVVTEGR